QSRYGDRWPSGSTWWEYSCRLEEIQAHNLCTHGACDAFCPGCWGETFDRTDYFYWNGSEPVFYGESYLDSVRYVWMDNDYPLDPSDVIEDGWRDAASASWYRLAHFALTVWWQGSGHVDTSPSGLTCPGFFCSVNVDAGSEVTLTAVPDSDSVFTGW